MSTPGWETVKENAAPLQRGRNVAALERVAVRGSSSSSSTALHVRNDDSDERIAEFERLVRPSEAPHITEIDDDPLVHWMAYIKYYQDNFPADTHQQFLLMERCTRALVKMPRYANDDRFISVCAKYADKTKEPGQVFKYLHQQKVGGQTALFWVAWAYVAEKDNDFPFAEQIYKKGISKDAQPLNILKVRHKQFQRRMSRYWLSQSQRNDQLEEDEDETTGGSRGVLGGLSQDRARRNDRARAAPQLAPRSRGVASIRPAGSRNIRSNTNNSTLGVVNNGSFAIFVENEGENAPQNFLDQPIIENKRVIERETDRRKENTLDAERWNERGGLHTTTSLPSACAYLSRPGTERTSSRGAPLPFAVFVDEECVAQHEREETERSSQAERHRSTRDERTFRERSDEGMVERLTRDPLRYVRDPTKFEADLATAQEQVENDQNRTESENDKAKRNRIGFNKKLLKNSEGIEQSFEEARARSGCYKLASSSVNFNTMHVSKIDQSSQMDLDDGASTDVSMAGTNSPLQASPNNDQPRKIQRLEFKAEQRVLFRSEPSFESFNQTNISTASSTVNESDAVGVLTRKEEETINTKLAMRELSMMFSSPAFGVDDGARKAERKTAINDDSRIVDDRGGDTSFANVGDGLGHSMLDNSILNVDVNADENLVPRNPMARTNETPGFEKMALRELKSVVDTDVMLGCGSRSTPVVATQMDFPDPLRALATDVHDHPGFQIYEDEELELRPLTRATTFQIYDENFEEEVESAKPSPKPSHQGLEFQIYTESEEVKKHSGHVESIFHDDEDTDDDTCESRSERSDPYAQGDTATFSLLGDTIGNGDVQEMPATPGLESPDAQSEQGDTATLSLFNEVFQNLSPKNSKSRVINQSGPRATGGGFPIFVDSEDDNDSKNSTSSRNLPKAVRDSISSNLDRAVDYSTTHSHNAKMALRRLQASSSVASNSRLPLLALLSVKRKSFHLPHIPLPRELRSKHLSGNTKIQIGKHSGIMNRELGRGAFGVVALMNVCDDSGKTGDTIAVKAQSPTDCLAWECEILRRLEDRTNGKIGSSAFPNALSFLSLADGAILSMTAGSNTGLNLVDLTNTYKLKLGEHVPEIITLHYVSRMLRHLEQLHWHGKILHCDVKPDNFVMCTLDCDDNAIRDIEFSDLMLVDFGRAVDLEDYCDTSIDARSVMFHGDACREEMKCVAMRGGKAWSYDIDTFGVLACAHVMLYGSHIKLKKGEKDRWLLVNAFKRYWQKDLWTKIFDTLLNLDEESGAAIGSRARSLRSLRQEIDAYTETEADKLRSFLTRQLTLLPSSRDQLK